jgi:stress response protein YsnF
VSIDNENALADAAERFPILEEHLSLTKCTVEAGRVQVRISNETNERRLQAELRSEAVEIERVAIGRELSIGEPLPVPHEE